MTRRRQQTAPRSASATSLAGATTTIAARAAGVPTAVAAVACALLWSCAGGDSSRTLIQNKGSDTLVNVAQAWAENYRRVRPSVAIAVSGGGSGTGIAALINGTVDIANSSRDIHTDEREKIKAQTGKDVVEHKVARDAIVVYVHKDNPIQKITLANLACIYGEKGTCDTWTSVGVDVPGCADQKIIRVSRQSNSGTYEYFREAVLGTESDFKLGSRDMQGSKDVVDLVSKTPCAIGYSGIGYATPEVRTVCLAKDDAAPCVPPTIESAKSGEYPLSRWLYMFTAGEPAGETKAYLDWIHSPEGQKIVADSGFIPSS
ncbi:MAG TPA: phosphate ABC transporter substrate-binding protein [Candidatus Limnocylindrales bacterium]|nr:phosphate ABC transporter substrate-binding protein [Candidatus Limnocylindrales bacterium]